MVWEMGSSECAGNSGNLFHDGKLIATLEAFPYSAEFNTRSLFHHNVFHPELAFAGPGAIFKNFRGGNMKFLSDLEYSQYANFFLSQGRRYPARLDGVLTNCMVATSDAVV
jgi:hypothetical protein